MQANNLYAGVTRLMPDEVIETLAAGSATRVERIVSTGQCSPPGFWYDQPEREWVAVLKGAATLRFEEGNRLLHLSAGDYVDIPAHERHRVEWTLDNAETIWLAVFYSEK